MAKVLKRTNKAQTKPLRNAPDATRPQAASSDTSDDTQIRVLCVDDHALLVEGLIRQFAIEDQIRVVGRLPSAEKLLDEATRLRPDVVILDIEMPGPDVFEMADRLRHMHPKMRFVFLSAHIREGCLAAAYKCGAWGYFAKSDDLDAIVSGIREVVQGRAGTFVLGPKVKELCKPVAASGPGVRPSLAKRESTVGPLDGLIVTPLSKLTMREVEVLRLIGKGLSRNQIAEQLSREVKTVDGHQKRIMRKLRIFTRADLMRLAIREGLAEA